MQGAVRVAGFGGYFDGGQEYAKDEPNRYVSYAMLELKCL